MFGIFCLGFLFGAACGGVLGFWFGAAWAVRQRIESEEIRKRDERIEMLEGALQIAKAGLIRR